MPRTTANELGREARSIIDRLVTRDGDGREV